MSERTDSARLWGSLQRQPALKTSGQAGRKTGRHTLGVSTSPVDMKSCRQDGKRGGGRRERRGGGVIRAGWSRLQGRGRQLGTPWVLRSFACGCLPTALPSTARAWGWRCQGPAAGAGSRTAPLGTAGRRDTGVVQPSSRKV